MDRNARDEAREEEPNIPYCKGARDAPGLRLNEHIKADWSCGRFRQSPGGPFRFAGG